jgi:hypothetical protein
MTSKEWAQREKLHTAADELGRTFAELLVEGMERGHQAGQEAMRERAAKECERPAYMRSETEGKDVKTILLPYQAAERIRALPVE